MGENKAIGQRVDDDDVVASGREHGGETSIEKCSLPVLGEN